MKDSERPAWLLRLLLEMRNYFLFSELEHIDVEKTFCLVETAIKETICVRRSKRYSLSECVSWEIKGNRMTIFTLFKNKPVVEFTIE